MRKGIPSAEKRLMDKAVLRAPNFENAFIVQTDALDTGMGVVLSQENKRDEEHPILYLNKKFSEVEQCL